MALQAAAHASIAALVRESPHDGARRSPRGSFGSLCLRAPVSRATGCRPFRRPARGRVAHLAIERPGPFDSRPSSPLRPALPPPAAYTVTGDRMMGRRTGKQRPGKRFRRFPNTHAPGEPAIRLHTARPPSPPSGTRPRSRRTRSTRGDDTTRAAPWTTTVPIRQPPLSPTAIVPRAAFRGPPRRPS